MCLLSNHVLAMRIRASLLFLMAVAFPLYAIQDQVTTASSSKPAKSDVPTFSSEVKVVNLLATVRDKHGKIVNDLSKDDFQLEEDGRQQAIKYFTRETDLPLKLGLLVDTSGSVLSVLPEERTASQNFLDQVLREDKDSAFLIHFDRQVELLQDFTSSRAKLQSSMGDIQPSSNDGNGGGGGGQNGGGGGPYGRGGGGGGPYGGRGGHHHGGGTLLYDAVFLGSDELMSKQQGRKALIILSDGVDHGSKETMAEAIATAQRADTIIYSILFADEEENSRPGGFGMGGHGGMHGGRYPPQEQRPDGKKILEQLSKETGGRMFKVSKKETVDAIYAEIEEDLRNQYSLAYAPDKGNTVGYHKIHLVAKPKDLVVQARGGYYFGQ